ncbi:MAG: alpha/beta hydrolase [Treponema sp.]|nr:alpha/beta hydrolase [Treponema sp.]
MYEKKSVKLANGETYAYIEHGEKNADKTFLLIHGNMSSSLHFLPLFLRMNDCRFIAPDLRGFGDSSYNSRFSALSELAEDVKLFADAVGINKAHVVGWSTGGGIVFELAARYPNLVASLFIIEGVGYRGYPLYRTKPDGSQEPYPNKDELALDPVSVAPPLAAFKTGNAEFFDQLWKAAIYVNNKPAEAQNKVYIAETLKQRNLVDVDWALAAFNMSDKHNGYADGSASIGKIKCPVTITCAEMDLVVPPATSRENAAAIHGSKLLEYPKCGHSPLVDCPDKLAADILAASGLKNN